MREENFFRGYHVTAKQRQILQIIVKGKGRDADDNIIPVDMDQLLEALPYKTTKQSMQFSIRALIRREFIEKGVETRRGRERVTYLPQPMALHVINLDETPAFVESSSPAVV